MRKKVKMSVYVMRRLTAIVLCLALVAVLTLPLTVHAAQDKGKVVRVGWYESPVSMKDENGRRSGYDYVYEQKLAAYTGWTYDYVEGSWSDLLQMLKDGKIDMMGDISYTEERAEFLLYPSLPMGTEDYYLFVTPDNTELSQGSYSSFNGKKIGVNKDSIQEQFFIEWAEKYEVETELVELTVSEAEAFGMVEKKELDALVTIDGFGDPEKAVLVCKIGSSDYYFAVTSSRTDIYEELEYALNRINDENRYFNQQMHEKYLKTTGSNLYLNETEKAWLSSHGTIKVGYMKDYLPFCAKDAESKQLTGALKEYLEYAASVIQNVNLKFDPIAFDTIGDAIDAMKTGQVNCVFPANFSESDAEDMGLITTPSVMNAEIYEIVRIEAVEGFGSRLSVKVAVDEGNVNYEKVLGEKFPSFKAVYYPDIKACLQAVANREADTVLVSNFRYNNLTKHCDKLGLIPISTGISMDNTFVSVKGDTELYSILNKTVGMVPTSKTNSVMTHYISEKEEELTFTEFLMKNLSTVLGIVAGVLTLILVLVVLIFMNKEKARRSEKLIASAEIDKLTGIYSKNFLFEYANRTRNKHSNKPMDTIVLDVERFHSINALNGMEFGDKVLVAIGEQIKSIFNEPGTLAGRVEADHFCIFRWHENNYKELLNKLQAKLDEQLPNIKIRLRMGVLPGETKMDSEKMYDRARIACNMARGQYNKQPLVVYDDSVREKRHYEQRLINDLKRAVQNQEFEVYYQPQYDIQSEPPVLKSAEALVRWRHAEMGMVMPGDFIPLFEEHGLIGEVDKCVWKKAARQGALWKSKYGKVIPVSVNLSRVDIFDPNLERTLEGLLRDNKLDHSALKLEVTESAYTENADQVIRIIERLRSKGFEIELDDFGTGYSSLGMLSSMPIDVLKMDRSFIINMHNSETAVQMVKLILYLAKEMKIPVIAEGVEDKIELMMLKEMGCDIVQGYYFSRPLPAAEFENFLNAELEKRFKNVTF